MSPAKPSRAKKKTPGPTSARPSLNRDEQAPSAFEKALNEMRHSPSAFPNVSARWLLSAAAITLLGIAVCAWLTLCLLYWQGSWQLLYHPHAAITRTPASVGLAYEPVRFAVTETGTTQLTGWWIPSDGSRFTILYLHGGDGNLSNTVAALAALHRVGVAVFAIDYRGYGQSQPTRPTEKQLRQDAEWALTWLTQTHHIPIESTVVYGTGLGANLAAELAADHSALAGAILDQPLQNPMTSVFNDPRSRLVPAHWLVKDRYDLAAASGSLRIPSLWLFAKSKVTSTTQLPEAYRVATAKKAAVWLSPQVEADPNYADSLHRWIDDL